MFVNNNFRFQYVVVNDQYSSSSVIAHNKKLNIAKNHNEHVYFQQ